MPEALDWSGFRHADNLLCVRLDGIGDLLMTTPALRALKEARPERKLTLLASPVCAEAARLIPEIDEVILYAAPWVKSSPENGNAEDLKIIQRLRSKQFDAAVIFTVFSQNPLPAALMCRLAGIPLTLAYCRENPYQLLSHWLPEEDSLSSMRHEVRRQLDLAAHTGAFPSSRHLSFKVPEEETCEIRFFLEENGLDPSMPFVMIHPGATAPSRRYPGEHFAAAADRIIEELDCQIVFTGSEEEMELVAGIRRLMKGPSLCLAGKISLARLGAVIASAALVISNNTSAAHMAAAIGTPVVDLYALTNPQHTPWAVASRVLYRDVPCKFCFKSVCPQGQQDCLRLVEPDEVVKAAGELLAVMERK